MHSESTAVALPGGPKRSHRFHPEPLPSLNSPLQIEYNRQRMDVDAKQMRVLITGLKYNTTYEFRVTCQESPDGEPRHRVVARTAPLILVKKPKLDIYAEPDTGLTMSFPPVDNRNVK